MFIKPNSVLLSCLVFASLMPAASARAQVLQDGDIVIGANGYEGGSLFGRIFRLRGQTLTLLVQSGANGIGFGGPAEMIIDSQGRIVFGAGGCGGNGNSSAILRYDPNTGVLSNLLCIPYTVGPGGPPPGFPPEATGFFGFNGLHSSRSLVVVIDDDVNGGTPQVSFAEAYGFSVAVFPRPTFLYGQYYDLYHAEAFRYVVDDGHVERGISTALIAAGGNQGVEMFATNGATYYCPSQGSRICRAGPDLAINLRAHTTIGGVSATVQGSVNVMARNEVIFNGEIIDNTLIPNSTIMCSIGGAPVTDENVPYDGTSAFRVVDGIRAIGMLDDGLFVTTSSLSAGYPFLFNLAGRNPFLNPYNCADTLRTIQRAVPVLGAAVDLAHITVDHGRILGGDDTFPSGKVWAITPTSRQVLSDDPQLVRPRDVAVFPAATPPLTAGALVIRVDSPLNVLLTDSEGHRIGYAADGTVVNDFADSGAVLAMGPEGHPRIYAIIDPQPGTFALSAVGTGDGLYTIRSYLAETSSGGMFITRTGQAQTGVAEDLSLRVKGPLAQAWLQLGDMNCDSAINQNDVQPFVQALLVPAAYEAQHPQCELFNADMNRDNGINGSDIQPFMTKLIQG